MRVIGYLTTVVVILALLLGLGWVIQGNNFFLYQYFGPKYEQTRRTTFEQSKAYNQGMIQELQNMQFEYAKADAGARDTLASVILHRASDYNMDDPRVPADLRQFVQDLKRERTTLR
jgi:hypothetical protein